MSLIYGEYLVNVHSSDILHTFIPHFTLHSAEKIRIKFSANYPLTTFRIPQSAFALFRCYRPVIYTRPSTICVCLQMIRSYGVKSVEGGRGQREGEGAPVFVFGKGYFAECGKLSRVNLRKIRCGFFLRKGWSKTTGRRRDT